MLFPIRFIQTFTFFLAMCFACDTLAQVPFAQVNQSPLLLNPSLAGAKNKHRLSLGYNNTGDNHENQRSNYHLSYDQFSKKIKSGIGLYYLYSNNRKDTIDSKWLNSLPNSVLAEEYNHHSQQHNFGMCIAPKLNVMNKANHNLIQFTISPSFFVEYNRGSIDINDFFDSQSYYNTSFTIDHPEGTPTGTDSTVTHFFQNSIHFQRVRTGFGFQLNSKNILFLVRVSHQMDRVNENDQFVRHQSPAFQTSYRGQERSHQLFSLEENISMGISIPKKSKASFYFTPIIGIGFKQQLNALSDSPKTDQIRYSHLISDTPAGGINYTHGSANFRFKKWLFGTAYTYTHQQTYYGGGIGFQNESIKIMSHWVFGKRHFQEITLSYLI